MDFMKLICQKTVILWVLIALSSAWRPALAAETESLRDIFKTTLGKAEQGDSDAQYQLGVMFYYGEGVSKDLSKAVNWIRKAAEQENADALYELGVMYERGEGVPQDDFEAAKWFRRAIKQGNNYHYLFGTVDEYSGRIDKAIVRYKRAAELGDTQAQHKLASIYSNGEGVSQNELEATKWYLLAAEQGDALAQLFLGIRFGTGKGVPEDYVQAYAWSNLAAAQGQLGAQTYKSELANVMTPNQIEKAQQLSSKLFENIHH